jgi:hypothetical protein
MSLVTEPSAFVGVGDRNRVRRDRVREIRLRYRFIHSLKSRVIAWYGNIEKCTQMNTFLPGIFGDRNRSTSHQPPDILADMVSRLTKRQAVKNCYDRWAYYRSIASRTLSRRR